MHIYNQTLNNYLPRAKPVWQEIPKMAQKPNTCPNFRRAILTFCSDPQHHRALPGIAKLRHNPGLVSESATIDPGEEFLSDLIAG